MKKIKKWRVRRVIPSLCPSWNDGLVCRFSEVVIRNARLVITNKERKIGRHLETNYIYQLNVISIFKFSVYNFFLPFFSLTFLSFPLTYFICYYLTLYFILPSTFSFIHCYSTPHHFTKLSSPFLLTFIKPSLYFYLSLKLTPLHYFSTISSLIFIPSHILPPHF